MTSFAACVENTGWAGGKVTGSMLAASASAPVAALNKASRCVHRVREWGAKELSMKTSRLNAGSTLAALHLLR
eukprot:1138166-Pelagomonas_calceolata.AAC.4